MYIYIYIYILRPRWSSANLESLSADFWEIPRGPRNSTP